MQNDRFQFQTVANTRQVVPGKKSPPKNQTLSKKKLQKLFFTLGKAYSRVFSTALFHAFP